MSRAFKPSRRLLTLPGRPENLTWISPTSKVLIACLHQHKKSEKSRRLLQRSRIFGSSRRWLVISARVSCRPISMSFLHSTTDTTTLSMAKGPQSGYLLRLTALSRRAVLTTSRSSLFPTSFCRRVTKVCQGEPSPISVLFRMSLALSRMLTSVFIQQTRLLSLVSARTTSSPILFCLNMSRCSSPM